MGLGPNKVQNHPLQGGRQVRVRFERHHGKARYRCGVGRLNNLLGALNLMKLLKHLTNAPVAVALAFLLVGAPAAPVASMLPGIGTAAAFDPNGPAHPKGCGSTIQGCERGLNHHEKMLLLAALLESVGLSLADVTLSNGDDGGSSWWLGYGDGDIGGQASLNCQFKLVAGIKLTICNDMDGDGDLEGAICVSWDQGGFGVHIGLNCPDDPD